MQFKDIGTAGLVRPVVLGAALALLAGCGGGGGGDGASGGGGGGDAAGAMPDGALAVRSLSVLTRFFVENFDRFETAAATLRASPKYSVQNRSWYIDGNANGRRDGDEALRTTNPLASARIEYAHAAGLTGAGVTVGVLDEGFRPGHEAITGRAALVTANTAERGHGTAVASVLAGDSASMIGVAPRASLLLGTYDTGDARVELTRRAAAAGAVAINNSWGYVLPATRANFEAQFAPGVDGAYLDALKSFAGRGVVVFAVSNTTSRTTSELMDALPLFVPQLEPGWLAVVNGDATWDAQTITAATRLSAPCNEAARWCIAAEGTWFAADADSATDYALVTGSSFATPMVSGALALLQQAFPDLTPHDLRVRLLASADNDFAGFVRSGRVELADGFFHDYSREWGHGFLDVRAALMPIGTTVSRMADGSLHDISMPLAVTGGATGDAVARSLSQAQVLATDALGGDFRLGGDALVARAAPVAAADRLMAVLPQMRRPDAVFGEYGGASLSLRAGDTELAVLLPAPGGDDPGAGLSVGRRLPAGAGDVYLGVNLTQDDGRLLPRAAGGAAARLAAVELGYLQETGGGFWSLSGGLGLADTKEMGPLAPDRMTLSSLRAEAGSRDVLRRGDRLALGVSLPMAVVSGSAEARLPVARSAGGIDYRAVTVDYAPDAREVNLSVVYDTPLSASASLTLGAIRSFNHGHVAGRTDMAAVVGLRLTF